MLDLPKIEQLNLPEGRRYRVPSGKLYPSVTTVLSVLSNDYIAEWKAAVGEKEAAQISDTAARRGSRIHSYCENYLLGKSSEINFVDKMNFDQMIPELNKITNIRCLESYLYSDKLEIAGSVDCIGYYEGVLSIIDFKTSSRLKYKQEITSYFLQCCFYALMFFEMTGIRVQQIVVIINVDFDIPSVFKENINNYFRQCIDVRKQYKEKYLL